MPKKLTVAERQMVENAFALSEYDNAMRELFNTVDPVRKRLRTCTAEVYETDNYYLLRSYNTFICVINKTNKSISDVLRHAYGYTSTSAQHIAKFIHDYTPYPWNSYRATYRTIVRR